MWEIVICDSDKSFASKLEDHVRNFYQDRKLETNVRIYTGHRFAGTWMTEKWI